jgi:hypothetical protein
MVFENGTGYVAEVGCRRERQLAAIFSAESDEDRLWQNAVGDVGHDLAADEGHCTK